MIVLGGNIGKNRWVGKEGSEEKRERRRREGLNWDGKNGGREEE
jgi:hypothetical protein